MNVAKQQILGILYDCHVDHKDLNKKSLTNHRGIHRHKTIMKLKPTILEKIKKESQMNQLGSPQPFKDKT